MTLDRILGIDTGAESLKFAWGATPEQCSVIPNYLDLDCLFRLVEPPKDPRRALHLEILESPCGITGEFAFGHLAEEHGGRPLAPRANKMADVQIRYAAVAALFADATAAKRAGASATHYGVELGLPLVDFREPANRKAFGGQFKGTYRGRFIETSNPAWAALGEISFSVDRILIGCEGAPAIKVIQPAVALTAWRAVADIGGSTIDIPVFEGDELRSAFCDAGDIGVNEAMEKVTQEINHTYMRDLTRAEVARILAADDGNLPNGTASPISILPIAERHLYPVALDAAHRLVQVWRRRSELMGFEMIGGGSLLLRPFLEKAVEDVLRRRNHQGPAPFTLRYVPNARKLNALGFYAQAERVFMNG